MLHNFLTLKHEKAGTKSKNSTEEKQLNVSP